MSQQEIGEVGKLAVGQFAELFQIVHHIVPTALRAEIEPGRILRNGQAVTDMVISHHGKALLRQILRKGLIAQNIFGNAVSNLQNGHRGAVWQP